ncbi:NUDIX hydrolase [Salarchaeum japonicum]|uniref:NUDIX hydrolase n=1 Tax=Salarchaeum japonicum TaxID=555573 RepID=UPI003C740A7F
MPIDDTWFLAQRAEQTAERAYHRISDTHDDFVEFSRTRHVGRNRFRTLAERIEETGAPFGAHTIVYRPSGELLLVRHDGVDLWVLPGGGVETDETYREAAERELDEEAGVDADYCGLAMVTRITVRSGPYETRGVLPVFAADATDCTEPEISDPDDEISAAQWFHDLPDDTRDRDDLEQWRNRVLA